jgi:hypothetical protein
MDYTTDVYCDNISGHSYWESRFGPRSGFGLFGRKARRIRGLDLSDLEWRALAVACALASVHWEQTGPFTVANNLNTLFIACDSNARRVVERREQKVCLHELEALVACAQWFTVAVLGLDEYAQTAGIDESGDAKKRQEAVKALTALIPRLRRAVSEAQGASLATK